MVRSLPGMALLISSVAERNSIPRLRKSSIRCRALAAYGEAARGIWVRLARVMVVDLGGEEFEVRVAAFGVGVKRRPGAGEGAHSLFEFFTINISASRAEQANAYRRVRARHGTDDARCAR